MASNPKEDLILLLLAAPEEPRGITGRMIGVTRLEKLVFLAQKQIQSVASNMEAFLFRPWKFGPFSEEIYDAIDTLHNLDLITVTERDLASYPEAVESEALEDEPAGEPVLEKVFELTPRGKQVADALRKTEIPEEVWKELCDLKKRFGNLPLSRLIHYVYHKFPETTAKSVLEHLKPKN